MKRSWSTGLLVACLWAPALLAAAEPSPGAAPALSAGSQFMVAFLDSIARNTDPVIDIYLNRARAAGIGTLLHQPMSDAKGMQLRVKIAEELLRGGLTQKALGAYQYVYREVGRRQLTAAENYFHMLRDRMGIAYLRLDGHPSGLPPHSWVFPMLDPPSGPQRGPRAAIASYTANLEKQPDDLGARWLLNIAYMLTGEYPEKVPPQWLIPPTAFASQYDIGHFADIAGAAGVAVPHHAGGSVVEDLDGDGRLDIAASGRGLRDQLHLFINQGDGSFDDRTRQAGLLGQLGGLNMTHADYDNDGDRDLLVLRGAWGGEGGLHPNSLLQNQGDGSFDDATRQAGIFSLHPTHSAAWGDYDDDGWLDVYIGNETSPAPKPPHPSELYRNQGDGTFVNTAAAAGVDQTGFVKGLVWGDYDNDGRLDLYLSQLNGDNLLFRNQGDGSFDDVSATAGVQAPYVSFPTWFWDFDNDGWQDILVAGFDMADLGNMAALYLDRPVDAEHHRLYRNQGDGSFAEIAGQVGLDKVILTMGANFGDLDNDGFLDCYFGTGMPDLRALLPNRMFRNDGGQGFQDVTTAGGFGTLQKGHGVSFGDFDDDGDQDIYQVLGAAFEGDIYPNVLLENPGHGNDWITLFLEGVGTNRDAIGGRIRVRIRTAGGNHRDIYATVGSGGSFGSSSLRQELGLGNAQAIDYIEVNWPGEWGRGQRFVGLRPNRLYRLRQGQAEAVEVTPQPYDMSPW